MKQAFHGEVYDTETAGPLACHELLSGVEALKGQLVVDLYRTQQGHILSTRLPPRSLLKMRSLRSCQSPAYRELDDKRVAFEEVFLRCAR